MLHLNEKIEILLVDSVDAISFNEGNVNFIDLSGKRSSVIVSLDKMRELEQPKNCIVFYHRPKDDQHSEHCYIGFRSYPELFMVLLDSIQFALVDRFNNRDLDRCFNLLKQGYEIMLRISSDYKHITEAIAIKVSLELALTEYKRMLSRRYVYDLRCTWV